jgi:hypothetical protein
LVKLTNWSTKAPKRYCYIDDENGKRVAKEVKSAGGVADFWHMDVSHASEVEKVFTEIYAKYGQINILVNNAGIAGGRGAPHKVPEAELDRVMATNMKGPFFCTKYAVPYMSKAGGGSIVNVASCYGIIGCDTPAYDASKGALRAMSKSDAICLRKHNIRARHLEISDTSFAIDKIDGGAENGQTAFVPVPLPAWETGGGFISWHRMKPATLPGRALIDGGMVSSNTNRRRTGSSRQSQ